MLNDIEKVFISIDESVDKLVSSLPVTRIGLNFMLLGYEEFPILVPMKKLINQGGSLNKTIGAVNIKFEKNAITDFLSLNQNKPSKDISQITFNALAEIASYQALIEFAECYVNDIKGERAITGLSSSITQLSSEFERIIKNIFTKKDQHTIRKFKKSQEDYFLQKYEKTLNKDVIPYSIYSVNLAKESMYQ
ncbi:MAG: hypothetical protein WCJ33_04960 [Pseudomonadota bacterium]